LHGSLGLSWEASSVRLDPPEYQRLQRSTTGSIASGPPERLACLVVDDAGIEADVAEHPLVEAGEFAARHEAPHREIVGRLNALLGKQAYPHNVRGVWGKMVARDDSNPRGYPLGELQDGANCAQVHYFELVVRFVRRITLFYDEGVTDLSD
jgi:hypothetical protein